MSGLLALLDDVAGIAKVAAASVDDVVAAAGKAGAKTAGVIIEGMEAAKAAARALRRSIVINSLVDRSARGRAK